VLAEVRSVLARVPAATQPLADHFQTVNTALENTVEPLVEVDELLGRMADAVQARLEPDHGPRLLRWLRRR
jgi:hypothetical protein